MQVISGVQEVPTHFFLLSILETSTSPAAGWKQFLGLFLPSSLFTLHRDYYKNRELCTPWR